MRLPLHQEALLKTMRPLNPTDEELANMSPQEREVVPELLKRNVFGEDYATDRQGNPVEQGFGAPGRHTPNHWAALRKAEQMGMEAPGTTERAARRRACGDSAGLGRPCYRGHRCGTAAAGRRVEGDARAAAHQAPRQY